MHSTTTPPKLLIFDLDGTLVNSLRDIAEATNRVLLRFGREAHPLSRYRDFVGEGSRVLLQRALQPTDAEELNEALESFRTGYERDLLKHTRPYHGVTPLLRALDASALTKCVLSNKASHLTRRVVEAVLGEHRWAHIMGKSPEFPHKPDPSSTLEILRSCELLASEARFVGDTKTDMQCAAAAGIPAVGVTWGFRSAEELWDHGASAVIDSPHELLDLIGA